MAKISLIIHTASKDNFLLSQGIESYFNSVCSCLDRQTFSDFEFVYVDANYDINTAAFEEEIKKHSFQIKHVPVHENHRYWMNRGNTFISGAKNTGILYADGELLITCDDSEFFEEGLLNKYWDYCQRGWFMHAFHRRMKSINHKDGKLIFPIDGDIYINDSRLTGKDIKYHSDGSWMYAGTSFLLEDAIKLNGFNEKMDGNKSLEDCDMGNRLSLIGRKFVIDKSGFVYILDHPSYADENKIKEFIAVENYGMYCCAKELFSFRANEEIDDSYLKIIKRETLKYRNFDPLSPENQEKLSVWLNTPTFDLKKEREELRNSPQWKTIWI